MLLNGNCSQNDRRNDSRSIYSRYIFYATRQHFFEGELKNYSRGGVFIKTPKILPVGTVVVMSLPYLEDRNNKCKGQVVRCTPEGIGIEFFKDPKDKISRKDLL
jgi:Tfp pilus assembly protein PilZ